MPYYYYTKTLFGQELIFIFLLTCFFIWIKLNSGDFMKKDSKKNNNGKVIIIILVCVIIAMSGVLGYLIYQKKSLPDNSGTSVSTEQNTQISPEALEAILNQQMMYVNGIHYYYQDSSSQLKHDAMGASVFNNSDVSITDFVVAFCAFDAEGNPIKILQPDEQGEGGYLRTINYEYTKAQGEKASLEPKETCKDILMYVKSEPQIVTVKACVKSYTSTDGISWSNPYYNTFLEIYSGKHL